MEHLSLSTNQSLFGALVGLALISACTNTELALGRNDAANPRAASAPLPALTHLSSSPDAQPATPAMAEERAAPQHDMAAGMKMQGDRMAPMDPQAAKPGPGMATGDAGKSEPPLAQKKAQHWTCTMHPSVDRPAPGKCPICGMKLVPKTDATMSGGGK